MNPAKYSFHWANDVVERLEEKYARETKISLDMLGMTHRDLVEFLANGDPLYPIIRDFIHNTAKTLQTSPIPLTFVKHLAVAREYLQRKGRKSLISRLDDVQKRIILREQGSRGDGGGGVADEPVNL